MLSKEEAASFYDQLTDYMENNGEDPKAVGKTFYEVYWSKAQVDHEYFDEFVKKSTQSKKFTCVIINV